LLWTNLYTLGLLNEDRPYAARFELIRLFVVLPLGMYALDPDLITIIPAGAAVIAIYILVSALWLAKK